MKWVIDRRERLNQELNNIFYRKFIVFHKNIVY